MKRYLIKTFILIVLFIFIAGTHYSTLGKKLETSITNDSFTEEYDPSKDVTGTAGSIASPLISTIVKIVNPILNIIQVIGAITMVVSIALFGIQRILLSDRLLSKDLGLGINNFPAPKMQMQLLQWARVLIIGSIILLFSSTFVKIMFRLFTGL